MIRRNWRLILLAVLFSAPFLFLIGYGSYALWLSGWGFWAWWPMFACLALAYFLALRWQRQLKLLGPVESVPPLHWTDRDKQAWQLVEARARAGAKVDADKLSSISFYIDTAQDMALELARFYHPKAKDPVGSLTLPEILAVIELAARDLAEMVDKYLPGGHLLTVNDWKKAKQAAEWYQTASNVYWAISTLFAPFNTGIRYLASHVGMSTPWQKLQSNLILWFYTAFVHRLGTYLIDLNSGRLRVGARRYRELLERHGPEALTRDETTPSPPTPLPPGGEGLGVRADGSEQIAQVTFAVLGQVKAGKSSLINALLGERRAATNVLPETAEITRYDLKLPDIPTRLSILDTVGYGHTGPRQDQLKATQEAARQSDVLLLVMQARNPARQADLEMMQALRKWFEDRPGAGGGARAAGAVPGGRGAGLHRRGEGLRSRGVAVAGADGVARPGPRGCVLALPEGGGRRRQGAARVRATAGGRQGGSQGDVAAPAEVRGRGGARSRKRQE
jgi:hypothetical protein